MKIWYIVLTFCCKLNIRTKQSYAFNNYLFIKYIKQTLFRTNKKKLKFIIKICKEFNSIIK